MKKCLAGIGILFLLVFTTAGAVSRFAPEKLYALLYPEMESKLLYNDIRRVTIRPGAYVAIGEYFDRPLIWKCVTDGEQPILQCAHIIDFLPYDDDSARWKQSELCEYLNTDDRLRLRESRQLVAGDVFLLSKAQLGKLQPADRVRQPTPQAIRACSSHLLFLRRNCWYWTSSGIDTTSLCAAAVTQNGGFYKTIVTDALTGICPAIRLVCAEVTVQGGNGSLSEPYAIGGDDL